MEGQTQQEQRDKIIPDQVERQDIKIGHVDPQDGRHYPWGGNADTFLAKVEGFGRGLGEQRFGKILKKVKDVHTFIEKIKKGGCQAGEHRAYMVAKVLKKAHLLFISAQAPKLLEGTPIKGFVSTKEALAFIAKDLGRKPTVFKTDSVFNAIYSADVIR